MYFFFHNQINKSFALRYRESVLFTNIMEQHSKRAISVRFSSPVGPLNNMQMVFECGGILVPLQSPDFTFASCPQSFDVLSVSSCCRIDKPQLMVHRQMVAAMVTETVICSPVVTCNCGPTFHILLNVWQELES